MVSWVWQWAWAAKNSDLHDGSSLAGCRFLVRVACLGAAGLSLLTSGARGASFQLNCDGLGTPQRMALGLREAVENDDIRKPLSDFLVMTLPSGAEVNLVSTHGASVRNWSNANGIVYSSAPGWPRDQLAFEFASYGIEQGTYLCDLN